MDTNTIRNEMLTAAQQAAQQKFNEIGGDRFACGFAWVTVYPEHKGNTKLGKAERRLLETMGFRKDWTGKAYEIWNPSGSPVQNIDIKEAGANAAAVVLRKYGFKAYSNSRLD